jgi:uncharacterized protein YfaP (DUF2135 family)
MKIVKITLLATLFIVLLIAQAVGVSSNPTLTAFEATKIGSDANLSGYTSGDNAESTLLATAASDGTSPAYAAFSSDEVQSNSTRETAQRIQPGQTLTGNLSADNIYAWYIITTTVNGSFSAIGTPSSSLATSVEMFFGDGANYITWAGTTTGVGVADTLYKNDLSAGTYYIRVVRNSGAGSFSVQPILIPAGPEGSNDQEPNDTKEDAITMNLNTVYSGQLGYGGNDPMDIIDWYTLTTTENGRLNIVLAPNGTLATHVDLFRSDGVNYLSWAGTTTGAGIADTLVVHNLAKGQYYVRAVRSSGYGVYQLHASLTPPGVPEDEEPNDDHQTAIEANLNHSYTGHLGYGGNIVADSQDWYVTTLTENGDFTIVLSPEYGLATSIEMRKDDGVNFVSWIGGATGVGIADTLQVNGLAKGTYFVRVIWNSGQGGYTLRMTHRGVGVPEDEEPNDTHTDAIAAEIGRTYTGHLGYAGNTYADSYDWYRITTDENGELRIIMRPQQTLASSIELRKSDAINYITWGGGATGAGIADTIIVPNLAKGDYYVRLLRNAGYGGYHVSFSTRRLRLAEDAEPNNTRFEATQINTGTVYTGHLGYVGNVSADAADWYRFQTTTAGPLSIIVRPTSALNTSIDLYDHTGLNYVTWTGASTGPGIADTLRVASAAANAYYMRINRSAGHGAYTMVVNPTADLPPDLGDYINDFDDEDINGGGDDEDGDYFLSGTVTNALTGQPLAGASVTIAGRTVITDQDGRYRLEALPAPVVQIDFEASQTSGWLPLDVHFTSELIDGYFSLSVSAPGYASYFYSRLVLVAGENVHNLSLSPILENANLRFVLNWGEEPRDLDSHMRTPDGRHVYFGWQGYADQAPWVTLDHDITTGYGPETMTVYQYMAGTYHYYVYNWSGSPAITTSAAVVQIYDAAGLRNTLTIPQTGEGRYWYVATIDGSTGHITIVNRVQQSEPGIEGNSKSLALATTRSDGTRIEKSRTAQDAGDVRASAYNQSNGADSGNTATVSNTDWTYSWNFGDGNSSTLANPTHRYVREGLYTVTLTATDGYRTLVRERTNYIQVGRNPDAQTFTLTGRVTSAVNGEPVVGATVTVSGVSATTDADGRYELSGIPEAVLEYEILADVHSGEAPLEVQFHTWLEEEYHRIRVEADGYSMYNYNGLRLQSGENQFDLSLSPVLQAGNLRFVLNWGAQPQDLDSHMLVPGTVQQSEGYHVYFGFEGYADQEPYVTLDHDITDGFGPETITVYRLMAGTYHYYVYNWSESPDITTSSGVVQIYGESGLMQTVRVPSTGAGLYWYVATIDGSTGRVTLINRIQEQAPAASGNDKQLATASEKVASGSGSGSSRTQSDEEWSYSWDFGDGNTSDLRDPLYTYVTPGLYTVTLTLTRGSTVLSAVRQDFIEVRGEVSVEEPIGQITAFRLYEAWPNPFNPTATVRFDLPESDLVTVEVYNMAGQRVMSLPAQLMPAGRHDVAINASRWSSGVYLYVVRYQGNQYTGKMTLLK